jgi:hypothetical protein
MSNLKCRSTTKGGASLSCEYEQYPGQSAEDSGGEGKDREFTLKPYVLEPNLSLYVWDRDKTPKLREYPVSADPSSIGKGTGKFASDREYEVVTVDERKPKHIDAPEGQYFVETKNKIDVTNDTVKGISKGVKATNAALIAIDAANFYLENRDEIDSVSEFVQEYGESIVQAVEDTAGEAVDALIDADLVRLGTIVVDNVVPVTFAGRFADNVADVLADEGVISKETAQAVDEVTDQVSDNFASQALNRVLDPFGVSGITGVKPLEVLGNAWNTFRSWF